MEQSPLEGSVREVSRYRVLERAALTCWLRSSQAGKAQDQQDEDQEEDEGEPNPLLQLLPCCFLPDGSLHLVKYRGGLLNTRRRQAEDGAAGLESGHGNQRSVGEISLDIRETVRLSGPVSLKQHLSGHSRWKPAAFPGRPALPVAYRGVIGELALAVGQTSPVTSEIYVAWDPSSVSLSGPSYVSQVVRRYFSDEDDIKTIEGVLSRSGGVMAEAVAYGRGLRILTQDPWECLASYVLSLNKNIPAISKTVEYLAGCFGSLPGWGHLGFRWEP